MNKLKRIGIFISISAVVFTALYYAALISIPYFVDLNKYKNTISSEIEKQTGFKVSCEDISFKKSYTPYFKIHLYHTLVLYPDSEVFLKLKEADLKVKIVPLIFKKIIIKDAVLTRPIINITLYKDFSTSLEKYFNADKQISTNGFKMDSIISDTICKRYKLKINDESINKLFYLEGDELLLKDLKLNEKVHLILKGSLFEGEKKYLNYDLDINSSLKQKIKQFKFSPFKEIYDYDVKGNIFGHLDIDKNSLLKGNLKLESFSLNIENNILDNNSANLIFKGEDVEFESELHTSKTDEAKVKGKFNYGKNKYIDLNAKAKNINLEKLFKVISVITESINIPNEYKDLKIKGRLNADFSINSDFKKLKSKGKAQIIDAELTHNSLPYKINKINSSINFDNNKIIIEKAQAFVNTTPISIEGKVNEDVSVDIKAYSDNLDLKTIIDLFIDKKQIPFNFVKGKLSFVSDIKGVLNKSVNINSQILLKEFSAVEKKSQLPIYANNIQLNILNDKNKYSGEVLCSDLRTMVNKKPILAKALKLTFDNNNIIIPPNQIILVSSPINIMGNIKDYMKSPIGQIKFEGNIASSNLGTIIGEYIKEPYKAAGHINTKGAISFVKDNIKVNAKLKANKDNYISYLVIKEILNKPTILNIDAEIQDKEIIIKDASITEESNTKTEPKVKVTGNILNEKEPIFKDIRIQIPEIISTNMNFFGGEEISLNGDITVNNTLKEPELKGNAKLQRYNIKKLYTAVRNADVIFSKNNIRVVAPDVEVNNSKFNMVLDIEPKISDIINILNVQLNSLNLDLNTLFPLIQNERNPFGKNLLNVKKGSATINSFKVLDIKANDISSDFTINNNILQMNNILLSAYNGKVTGDMSYDINHAQLSVNLTGKGLDIKESLYDLCKIKDNLAGKVDFISSLTLLTGDYNQVIKSIDGEVTYDAVNGKMGTLGKFEYYLYAQNLLYYGLLNATLNRIADTIAPDNTARFKESKGSLVFNNGYLITKEIKTIGPNMSLYIKGRHNLLTNQANIDIYGRISDEISSKLGSFGDVSISEFLNGQSAKKNVSVMKVPQSIMSNIPELYSRSNDRTKTFKVNIYGNINSVSSINSFMWIIPNETEIQDNKLPEFNDMTQDL